MQLIIVLPCPLILLVLPYMLPRNCMKSGPRLRRSSMIFVTVSSWVAAGYGVVILSKTALTDDSYSFSGIPPVRWYSAAVFSSVWLASMILAPTLRHHARRGLLLSWLVQSASLTVILAFHILSKEWRAVTTTAIALAASVGLIGHEVAVMLFPTLMDAPTDETPADGIASASTSRPGTIAAPTGRSVEPRASAPDHAYQRYAPDRPDAAEAAEQEQMRGWRNRDGVVLHEYSRGLLPVAVPVDRMSAPQLGDETPIEGEVIIEGQPIGRLAPSDSELSIAIPATATHWSVSVDDKDLCKVCLDFEADTLLMPCKHLCSCSECAAALTSCPICRTKIADRMRVYR